MSDDRARVSAVLFDWDGTLVDTGDILLACWHSVTEEVLGYRFPVEEADRRRVMSMRAVESFPTLSDDPAVVERLHVTFSGSYAKLAPSYVTAHRGAADVLAALAGRGVRTGVVTSKTGDRREVDADLARIDEHIDVVITGDDVARGKPDPEGILRALSILGVDPAEAVYVGDGPVDIRAGRAAGMRTIGLTHGLHSRAELLEAEPDHIIDALDTLLDVVLGPDDDHAGPSGRLAAEDSSTKEHS